MRSNPPYYDLKLPETRQPKCELWKQFDQAQLETLVHCFEQETTYSTYTQFSCILSHQLGLDPVRSRRDQILVDKHFYLVQFALAQNFSRQQLSALISIFTRTHALAIDTCFGNLDETFEYFKQAVLVYVVHRPPFSIQLFTPNEAQLCVDYFMQSYFKQFKAFKYVFTPAVLFDVSFKYNGLVESSRQAEATNDEIECVDLEEEKEVEARHGDEENSKEASELRAFVKAYLNERLDRAKEEILGDEIMKQQHGNHHKNENTKNSVRTKSRGDSKTPTKKK